MRDKIIAMIVQRLRDEMENHAAGALRHPDEHNIEFAYGRVAGVYQGLERAEEIINEVLTEDANG